MILEIEYYKNDTFLLGNAVDITELKNQLNEIEKIYDVQEDNFTELFCRVFGWSVTNTEVTPDFIYDRDIKRLNKTYR